MNIFISMTEFRDPAVWSQVQRGNGEEMRYFLVNEKYQKLWTCHLATIASSIAAEIRKMPEWMQCMVKNEMNQVVSDKRWWCEIPIKCIELHLKIAFKFSINKGFKYQKPHFLISNHQMCHHLIPQAPLIVQKKLTMLCKVRHSNTYI